MKPIESQYWNIKKGVYFKLLMVATSKVARELANWTQLGLTFEMLISAIIQAEKLHCS